MKREMMNRGLAAMSLLTLLVAFQNCSPSFHSLDGSSPEKIDSSKNDLTLPVPAATEPPPVEKVVSASENQPISINVNSSEILVTGPLPAGASYDSSTGVFLWLPKVGQAGLQTVDFKTAIGKVAFKLKLQIAALTAAALSGGPIDGAKDGDVGFIFIHGLGEADRCSDPAALASYWGAGPSIIARVSKASILCYDERASVETVAPQIAQKILDSDCGRFGRCILVTHSMGGLVTEFIMTHARAATAGDAEPALFDNAALFVKAKDRTLSVISLASAAGGSKVADFAANAISKLLSAFISQVVRWMGLNSASVQSVQVARASNILAPISEDPGVLVYMIPGFSPETAWEWDRWTGGLYGAIFNEISVKVFQGDLSLVGIDGLMQLASRFDGLVDFRSACGIRSSNPDDGPGYSASLVTQLLYCAQAVKKANHFVWFATSMNHFLIPTDWAGCLTGTSTCQSFEFNVATQSLDPNSAHDGWSAVRVARAKLDANRKTEITATISYSNGSTSSSLIGGL